MLSLYANDILKLRILSSNYKDVGWTVGGLDFVGDTVGLEEGDKVGEVEAVGGLDVGEDDSHPLPKLDRSQSLGKCATRTYENVIVKDAVRPAIT